MNNANNEEKKWHNTSIGTDHIKTKVIKGMSLSYTSWQQAWKSLYEHYPYAKVQIVSRIDSDGSILEYHGNEMIGYCVFVRLIIDEMNFDFTERLAILDGANNPQKYQEYQVTDKYGKVKVVEAFGIDDVNNTIQRCTVKVIARAGIGLNVYEGDFSDIEKKDETTKRSPQEGKSLTDEVFDKIKYKISMAETRESLDKERQEAMRSVDNMSKEQMMELRNTVNDRREFIAHNPDIMSDTRSHMTQEIAYLTK